MTFRFFIEDSYVSLEEIQDVNQLSHLYNIKFSPEQLLMEL
jgi:hypothetical protein